MLPFSPSGRTATVSVREPAPLALPKHVRERWHALRAQLVRPAFAFDLLRIYLGIGLIIRGALFAREPALLNQFIDNSSWLFPMLLAHALVLSHVVGGLMLALGCCTRWAAGVQIPFVAAALFFVHWHEGLLARTQSVEFAALVLCMLLAYLACGAGPFSLDEYFQRAPAEVATGEPALSFQWSARHPYASTTVTDPGQVTDAVNADGASAGLLTELTGADLDMPAEPADARQESRDVARELTLLALGTTVVFVLLATGFYLAAAAGFMGGLVLFVIWRIGQAHFE